MTACAFKLITLIITEIKSSINKKSLYCIPQAIKSLTDKQF